MSGHGTLPELDLAVDACSRKARFPKAGGYNHYLVATIKVPDLPEGFVTRNPIDLVAAVDFSTSLPHFLSVAFMTILCFVGMNEEWNSRSWFPRRHSLNMLRFFIY